MTSSVEVTGWRACTREAAARLLHRRSPKERDHRAVRDPQASPADPHADVKEPWYFARDMRLAGSRRGGPRRTRCRRICRCSSAAAGATYRRGTPSYLRSSTAASRIAELQPDARIIAILREPASLVRSLHLQFVQTHVETEKDLRKALALEHARRQGRHIPRVFAANVPVCRPHSLCRAAAPLPRRVSRRTGAGAHLRRFPSRQRVDGTPGPALSGGGRLAFDRDDRGEPHRPPALAAPERTGSGGNGGRPDRRRVW